MTIVLFLQLMAFLKNPMKILSWKVLHYPLHRGGSNHRCPHYRKSCLSESNKPDQREERYSSLILEWASKILPDNQSRESERPQVNWSAPKRPKSSIYDLITDLDQALKQRQWFVTGFIDPIFFSDNFQFKDPNVEVAGVRNYAEGVQKIFNSDESRLTILDIAVKQPQPSQPMTSIKSQTSKSPKNTVIRVTWEIDAVVNFLFGLRIKPYIIHSDLEVDDQTGLIISQEDIFTIPEWQILLRSILPF